jgi:hypothetical protein
MKKSTIRALALLAGGAVLASASTASAASVDCTNATLVPHPVYIAGASEAKAYLQSLAGALGSSISLIYAAPSACVGLSDIATPGQTEGTAAFSYITTAGVLETCTGAAGAPYPAPYVDVGVSGVFATTCITPQIPNPLPATLKDWDVGTPVQPEEIVVPWTSTQNSISADAAYVVFGFGGETYTVTPWTVTTDIWTRGVTAGAQLIVAEAIGLSGAKWLSGLGDAGAAQIATSATILSGDITTSAALGTGPNPVIGILGSGTVDPLKNATGGIKPLAFQGIGQDCGYYPDSQLSTYDKINVRQGRYEIWGPEHFLTNVDGSGNPIANPKAASNPVPSASADVKTLIGIITHNPSILTLTSTPTLQNVIIAEANAYFVPECAMQVQRTSEIGAEASYQPNIGCGCFYESQPHGGAGSLSSYCVACPNGKSDCVDKNYPACNFGYCEAQ